MSQVQILKLINYKQGLYRFYGVYNYVWLYTKN